MINFLIIGSNSFSGSNFINFLIKKKHRVIGISRSKEKSDLFASYKNQKDYKKKFKFYKLNINSNKDLGKIKKIVNDFKPKFIVNFAAQGMVNESWDKPEDWYNTNIVAQTKLYKILKGKSLKKIIHVTTPEVYGDKSSIINEEASFNPSTPYAISRMALDFHLKLYFKNFRFPIIFTRTANVYGPTQDLYRIVPKTILFSHLNKKIFIDGTGQSRRSFIYIDDASEATYAICKKGKIGETYHISTNRLISIKNLVKKIYLKKSKKNLKLIKHKKDRVGKDQLYHLSSKKLRDQLKWKPKFSLEQGLFFTEKWIENNIKKLSETNFNYSHKK